MSYWGLLAGAYVGTWWHAYFARRRGQLDVPLDRLAKEVRWALACGLLWLCFRLDPEFFLLRVACIWGSLTFVAWPNCAYRVTRALRWAHLLPQASPEYARTMRLYWGQPTDDDLEWDRQERLRTESARRGRQK